MKTLTFIRIPAFLAICVAAGFPLTIPIELAAELNVARPEQHPYVDPLKGRAGYQLAGEEVNESRVYDFYQRQADYYMAGNPVPAPIPAFPGLDAGQHGHWGKHNQNGYEDGRWNDMDMGRVQEYLFRATHEGQRVSLPDGISVLLGEQSSLAVAFDPSHLNYRVVWQGGFIHFDPYRWGTSNGVKPVGKTIMAGSGQNFWGHDGRWLSEVPRHAYHGYYRHGAKVIFSYQVAGSEVMDHPWALGDLPVLTRTFQFQNGASELQVNLLQLSDQTKLVSGSPTGIIHLVDGDNEYVGRVLSEGKLEGVQLAWENGQLNLKIGSAEPGARVKILLGVASGDQSSGMLETISAAAEIEDLTSMLNGGNPTWPQTFTLKGERAEDNAAYVVDKIPVPFENPYRSLMFLTGVDFFPNGDAVVTTLMGDVWRVTGLDDQLQNVTWKRVGTGLSQPFDVHIWDGQIHVMQREQISILHDLNGDDEIDFYENYANDFHGLSSSHSHTFGFGKDAEGNRYLVGAWDVYKLAANGGPAEIIASGVRNCMGFGMTSDGAVLVGPQEGTSTPASPVIEVRRGEFYGFQGDEPVSPPMVYIPRGVENSIGGFLQGNSDRWGPLGQSILGFSYGYGSWYQIIRDTSGPRSQGTIVPMDGEFSSGIVRGNFNPKDGQLYTAGLDGWGNYAVEDGCLNRVRYTGKPVLKPINAKVHHNGIRVNFATPLDPAVARDTANYFAQMWNYQHSGQYGSPEYSIQFPDQLGHDLVTIRSVYVLPGNRSIFLEIPDLIPAMSMHVRLHLQTADGTPFKTDIFPTILHLGDVFAFEGQAPINHDKLHHLVPRGTEGRTQAVQLHTQSGDVDEHARRVTINTIAGLKYDQTEIRLKAGESIALELRNADIMPHNLVLAKIGAYETVGLAAFKMLNDPRALEKNYVPDLPQVLMHTAVVPPKGSHTAYFKAPLEPGRYPFMCTFPGHWQLMKGVMIVE